MQKRAKQRLFKNARSLDNASHQLSRGRKVSNSDSNSRKLIKLTEVLEITTLSKATVYRRINAGQFPPQINLGGEAVAWWEHEIEALVNAWVANKSKPEINTLVSEMVEARKEAA